MSLPFSSKELVTVLLISHVMEVFYSTVYKLTFTFTTYMCEVTFRLVCLKNITMLSSEAQIPKVLWSSVWSMPLKWPATLLKCFSLKVMFNSSWQLTCFTFECRLFTLLTSCINVRLVEKESWCDLAEHPVHVLTTFTFFSKSRCF